MPVQGGSPRDLLTGKVKNYHFSNINIISNVNIFEEIKLKMNMETSQRADEKAQGGRKELEAVSSPFLERIDQVLAQKDRF